MEDKYDDYASHLTALSCLAAALIATHKDTAALLVYFDTVVSSLQLGVAESGVGILPQSQRRHFEMIRAQIVDAGIS